VLRDGKVVHLLRCLACGPQERVVSATFQSGYVMKGQLVRPARVQVFSTEGSL